MAHLQEDVMIACLSPNGPTVYQTQRPATELIVGTADGVAFLEQQAAGAWALTRRALAGRMVNAVLYEPRQGGLFAALNDDLLVSLDHGQTWESRTNGLTARLVFTLASIERDGQVILYAGTEPAHLFQSADYGETWEEVTSLRDAPSVGQWKFPGPPFQAHVKDVIFDPRDANRMYVGVETGALLKSEDAGQTWRELDGYCDPGAWNYKDIHHILLSPTNPDEVYLATGEGLVFSADGGERWRFLHDNKSRISYPLGVIVSPRDGQTIFLAGARWHPGNWRTNPDADGGIVRSRDAGRTWEELKRGLPDHIYGDYEGLCANVFPDGYTLFLGSTDGDVYLSDDDGDTWKRIAEGVGAVSKGGHHERLPKRWEVAAGRN
jgi:photosystem II stability/assembly factor-like uncharacterized protein